MYVYVYIYIYAVHTRTQFKIIAEQSYKNLLKLEKNKVFMCLSMTFLQTSFLKNSTIFTEKPLC